MPSPFPGMNPYLEVSHIWEDFHQNLATEIQTQLADQIDPNYFAALEPKITYEEISISEVSRVGLVKPDVGIWERDYWEWQPQTGAAIAPAPLIGNMVLESSTKTWTVEIRSVDYGTLVTSIEILSPVNKKQGHKAFDAYKHKRQELMWAGVNFMEIDLLREGVRFPTIQKLPNVPYFVFLSREKDPSQIYIWPLSLRSVIPILPVPLREPDADVRLDLTQAIHRIYDRARYGRRIRYAELPPKPEFSADDLDWVDTTLKNANLRQ